MGCLAGSRLCGFMQQEISLFLTQAAETVRVSVTRTAFLFTAGLHPVDGVQVFRIQQVTKHSACVGLKKPRMRFLISPIKADGKTGS